MSSFDIYSRLWPIRMDGAIPGVLIPDIVIHNGYLSKAAPTTECQGITPSHASSVAEALQEILESALRLYCRDARHRSSGNPCNPCEASHDWQTRLHYEHYGLPVTNSLFNFWDKSLQEIAEHACQIQFSDSCVPRPIVSRHGGPNFTLTRTGHNGSFGLMIRNVRSTLPRLPRQDNDPWIVMEDEVPFLHVYGSNLNELIQKLTSWMGLALLVESRELHMAELERQLIGQYGELISDGSFVKGESHAIQVRDLDNPARVLLATALSRVGALAKALSHQWTCTERWGCCLPARHKEPKCVPASSYFANDWSHEDAKLAAAKN